MTRFPKNWARPVAALAALVLGFTVTAAPAAAAEAQPAAPTAKPTLSAVASAKLAKLNTNAALAPAQASGVASSDKPFFKSTKGAVVLILLAVGTGYTIYSTSHDRVSSPIR